MSHTLADVTLYFTFVIGVKFASININSARSSSASLHSEAMYHTHFSTMISILILELLLDSSVIT